ncbi:tetratricopeptide repeat protein [Variibacter gotjawalensis]|uniref:Tetratricopeptide repeat protein n=1 Tax=Variibacter gotjawalensis TaxID=1333996 RepID=A0A0S3PQG2_9BRAD|nr:ATP-binding protein [Variibacter gotjawalensis]NIK48510.1 tetratricopeptide (TPR) repeat protein [Variibacter gotjawalensis]RZS50375.1 hypothetical protein EV661_2839 [Variibacter gotjawalensis]BAT58210.1 tetratricopeptide repeat protein [Variibacter gotjawalensis]
MRRIRVFVSSPGDARFERARLARVIERLNGEFRGVAQLEPIRWETEFYKAHDTFQAQIPESAACDMVIAVFRSRLGTELPPSFPPDAEGRAYPSGTAYEVLSAIHAARQHGHPDVYVFRATEPPVVKLEDPERSQIESQWERLKQFFDDWFISPEGQFIAALQTFNSTDDFEEQAERLLRKWLEEKVLRGRSVVWPADIKGSPFRGLAAFGYKHASVFFGRNRDIAKTVDRFKDASEKGCAFLLLNGASGSGKSSLARAGLVPRLTAPGVVPQVDHWRVASMRVGEVGGDPTLSLARRLFDRADDLPDDERGRPAALPELSATDFRTPEDLASLLRHADPTALRPIIGALDTISREVQVREGYQRAARADLLLLVDQLDDIFSADTTEQERTRFITLLDLLARSGRVWVIATLRADLYEQLLNEPDLRTLKEAGASYDLAAPQAAELAEIVRAPAQAADLTYETDPASGEPLDERLLKDADRPDLLPLLQFTLNQLFEARESNGSQTLLTFKAYRALGGLEGAVDKEAERAIAGLSETDRARLPRLLRQLAIPAAAGSASLDIRSVPRSEAAYDEASANLVRALVDARILLASGESAEATVRLAHARVLQSWKRASAIVAENADFYRIRADVEGQRDRWQKAGKSRDLLVGAGLPLAEAEQIVKTYGDELPSETKQYVAASGSRARLRQRAVAAAAIVFACVAALAGWQWVEASRNAQIARAEKARAEANFTAAKGTVDGLIFDIAIGLENLEGVRGEAVQKILETVRKTIDTLVATAPNDADLQRSRAAMLLRFSEIYTRTGDAKRAMDSLQEALAIVRKLLTIDPKRPLWLRDQIVIFERIAILTGQMGNAAESERLQDESLVTLRKLIADNPDSVDLQRDLMVTLKRTGQRKLSAGNLAAAQTDFAEALKTIRALVARDANNAQWQNDLADTLVAFSDGQTAAGDNAGAITSLEEALTVSRALVARDNTNIKWARDLTLVLERLGDTKAMAFDPKGALPYYEEAVQISRRNAALDPNDLNRRRDLATGLTKIAGARMLAQEFAAAQVLADEALEVARDLAKRDPDNAQRLRDLSKALQFAATIRYFQDKVAESEVLSQEALEVTRRLVTMAPNDIELLRDLSGALRRIADARAKRGDYPGAIQGYEETLVVARRVAAQDRGDGVWLRDLTLTLSLMATAKEKAGDREGLHAVNRERIENIRKLLARAPLKNDVIDAALALYGLFSSGGTEAEKRAWLEEALGLLDGLERGGQSDANVKGMQTALRKMIEGLPK